MVKWYIAWGARVCKHVSLAQVQSQSTVLDLNKVVFANHSKGELAAAVTLSSTIGRWPINLEHPRFKHVYQLPRIESLCFYNLGALDDEWKFIYSMVLGNSLLCQNQLLNKPTQFFRSRPRPLANHPRGVIGLWCQWLGLARRVTVTHPGKVSFKTYQMACRNLLKFTKWRVLARCASK